MNEQHDNIGYCECCGVVDHHRINGLCASCNRKAITFIYHKEMAIGYEAADVTTISGYSPNGDHK